VDKYSEAVLLARGTEWALFIQHRKDVHAMAETAKKSDESVESEPETSPGTSTDKGVVPQQAQATKATTMPLPSTQKPESDKSEQEPQQDQEESTDKASPVRRSTRRSSPKPALSQEEDEEEDEEEEEEEEQIQETVPRYLIEQLMPDARTEFVKAPAQFMVHTHPGHNRAGTHETRIFRICEDCQDMPATYCLRQSHEDTSTNKGMRWCHKCAPAHKANGAISRNYPWPAGSLTMADLAAKSPSLQNTYNIRGSLQIRTGRTWTNRTDTAKKINEQNKYWDYELAASWQLKRADRGIGVPAAYKNVSFRVMEPNNEANGWSRQVENSEGTDSDSLYSVANRVLQTADLTVEWKGDMHGKTTVHTRVYKKICRKGKAKVAPRGKAAAQSPDMKSGGSDGLLQRMIHNNEKTGDIYSAIF
jgi:hypothetical protein